MKIYHINEKIVQVNWDNDDFSWENNTNNASIFEIDEIDPENKETCIDLIRTNNKVDIDGNPKYYMQEDEGTWNLYERDDWEEYVEDEF